MRIALIHSGAALLSKPVASLPQETDFCLKLGKNEAYLALPRNGSGSLLGISLTRYTPLDKR